MEDNYGKKGIIGKKLGMTQVFDEAGNCLPVTLIEAGPCVVIQKKTVETDGYDTVKLGFDDVSAKKLNKPERASSIRRRPPTSGCCASSTSTTPPS